MNPDFVIGGKGQPALFNPDWAVSSSSTARQDAGATEAADTQNTTSANNARRSRGDDRLGPEPFEADLSFDDFLDIINPLQHIPVVNMIYREITGDKISGMAQIVGSTILGGPLGLISGVANAVYEEETGKTVVASLFGPSDGKPPVDKDGIPAPSNAGTTMLADANTLKTKKAAEEIQVAAADDDTVLLSTEQTQEGAAASEEEQTHVPLAPAPQKSRMENGKKFFSLASVPRIASSEGKMPTRDAPDVRLKPVERQAIMQPRPAPETLAGLPLLPEQKTEKILGLDADSAATELASVEGGANLSPSSIPPSFHGRNPLPPQLIEDMMLMNMQKYQDSLKSAPTRGSQIDIGG